MRSPMFIHPIAQIIGSVGITTFLICSGVSLVRSQNYRLQFAQYQLEVDTALTEARHEINDLDREVEKLPIATPKREKFRSELKESQQVLERVAEEVETERDKLIKPEKEE